MRASTRRAIFVVLLFLAVLSVAGALAVGFANVQGTGTWLAVVAGVLGAILVAEIVILLTTPQGGASRGRGRSRRYDDEEDDAEEDEEDDAEELLLRCASCREVFAVRDDGRRPLRHTCPHCGRSGILRETPAAKKASYGPGFQGRR